MIDRQALKDWARADPEEFEDARGCMARRRCRRPHYSKGYCRYHYSRRIIAARRIIPTREVKPGWMQQEKEGDE